MKKFDTEEMKASIAGGYGVYHPEVLALIAEYESLAARLARAEFLADRYREGVE